MQLTAVFQKVPEGFVAFVEELPGANTQASTLEEARESLAEAVSLVLEANRAPMSGQVEALEAGQVNHNATRDA